MRKTRPAVATAPELGRGFPFGAVFLRVVGSGVTWEELVKRKPRGTQRFEKIFNGLVRPDRKTIQFLERRLAKLTKYDEAIVRVFVSYGYGDIYREQLVRAAQAVVLALERRKERIDGLALLGALLHHAPQQIDPRIPADSEARFGSGVRDVLNAAGGVNRLRELLEEPASGSDARRKVQRVQDRYSRMGDVSLRPRDVPKLLALFCHLNKLDTTLSFAQRVERCAGSATEQNRAGQRRWQDRMCRENALTLIRKDADERIGLDATTGLPNTGWRTGEELTQVLATIPYPERFISSAQILLPCIRLVAPLRKKIVLKPGEIVDGETQKLLLMRVAGDDELEKATRWLWLLGIQKWRSLTLAQLNDAVQKKPKC